MLLERDLILFQSDPAVILNNFKSEDKKYVMAARIQGSANTAYPDGKHGGEGEDELDADFVEQGEINVVLVADSDMLADRSGYVCRICWVFHYHSRSRITATSLSIPLKIFPVIVI